MDTDIDTDTDTDTDTDRLSHTDQDMDTDIDTDSPTDTDAHRHRHIQTYRHTQHTHSHTHTHTRTFIIRSRVWVKRCEIPRTYIPLKPKMSLQRVGVGVCVVRGKGEEGASGGVLWISELAYIPV